MHSYMAVREADHPAFASLKGTDIVAVGAAQHEAQCLEGTRTLATFIPPYPIYPPEFSWHEPVKTPLPAMVERKLPGGGSVITFLWAIDCAYGRLGLPDHGDLLAGCVRYLLKGAPLIEMTLDGYASLTAYRQERNILLHIVNLNVQGFPDGYAERCIPIRNVMVRIRQQPAPDARAEIISGGENAVLSTDDEGYTIALSELDEQALVRITAACPKWRVSPKESIRYTPDKERTIYDEDRFTGAAGCSNGDD